VTALSLFLAVAGTFAAQERAEASTPGAAADGGVQQDRLAWFREARFGMFIHWGPYSELAGEWNEL
jgi:alpha-L-fucosidase